LADTRYFWCREVLDFFEIPVTSHPDFLRSKDQVNHTNFEHMFQIKSRRNSYFSVAEMDSSLEKSGEIQEEKLDEQYTSQEVEVLDKSYYIIDDYY
jgi:hypothetical protein